MDNLDLFDGKEIYLQIVDLTKEYSFVNQKDPKNCYHILVREWDPETWLFGPLYEVKVDKQAYSNKFA